MDPGTSSSSADFHEPITHDHHQYDEAFPALPPNPSGPNSGSASGLSSPGASSKWSASAKMRIGSNIVTSVFHIPHDERKGHGFGEMAASRACADITKQTGATIEMSSSRDQSLTFLVTGKQNNVLEAKSKILAHFQTQATQHIQIPKEHHRFILGKQGAKLNDLEKMTATKISVPRPNDDSNTIQIQGTREGIEKAVHEIKLISDEQSKQASERLSIPKKYHPFINGPFNEKVERLQTEHKVRINIPPLSIANDEIYIVGEKEGVGRVKAVLIKDNEEWKKFGTVSVEVGKSQHRHVIGHRRNAINEILQKTGVSVEMPPTDTAETTITLRGPPEALGQALTLVYEKANSVVTRTIDAPAWIQKYIIGKKGANIRDITKNYNKVHVEILDQQNQIIVEGPPEEVEPVTQLLQAAVSDFVEKMYFKDITVDPKHHKHIIGKNGANVNRIKDETGVVISVKDGNSSVIHLEGTVGGVESAIASIKELVEKLEGEKEKDLVIEHRFHGNIIGSRGEKIREIRDQFNQVQITFPPLGEKRDIVQVRGPKEDVDRCCRHLMQMYKDMVDSSFQIKVPVFPQCYRLLVGKGGKNIKLIREETRTRIDLPPLDESRSKTEAEIIVITGKKQDCEAARDKLLNIQNSVANVVEIDMMIPCAFHNYLIGSGGKLVQSISEECGGVQIKFPDSKSKSDRVSLIGPKEDVEKAKTTLLELTREKENNSYTETIVAKSQHHKFLIGKNGSNIRKLRESTGARVMFPNEGEPNADTITIIGKKESVFAAKKQLEEMLKDLHNVVDSEMDVDPSHHRHFVLRRGEILRQISEELGGVQISFPKANSNSSRVTLKGAQDCVDAAKKRIMTIVEELTTRRTVKVEIDQMHHRTIMGPRGTKVQRIQSDWNVDIKFPDRKDDHHDGHNDVEENGETARNSNIIFVSGQPESCEGAKQALLDLIPVSLEVEIPFEMHRFIIGAKGKDVRELMSAHSVNIIVPPSLEKNDTIVIYGSPKDAAAAKEALIVKREEREEEKKLKELKSFVVEIRVDPEYHPKIIGKKGAIITKIRDKYDVNIQLPKKNETDEDLITITGYEDKAQAASDEIMEIVNSWSERVKIEVEIDHRVHSRIIGARGKNVRQIMTDYNVDIRFPRSEPGSNPNLVSISGSKKEQVEDARDHLQNLEEEFIQDVTENEYMQQFVRDPQGGKEGGGKNKAQQSNGFVVKGAPWEQAPDTQSNEEFPSFGNGVSTGENASSRPISSAWGARKHF